MRKLCEKNKNCIIALTTILIGAALMGIGFDFYYDLNDDVLIKDVLAGVYGLKPDGHNMQILYPLAATFALLYRLCRGIPWYGLFLCVCQFLCFYLVSERILVKMEKKQKAFLTKGVVLLSTLLFMWTVWLSHMVNLQYTITCTMLSATAIFLFSTTPRNVETKVFRRQNIGTVLLVVLAFQLRSEMLLLTCPYIAIAGFFLWMEEEKFFTKDNWKRYGVILGAIATGMLLSLAVEWVGYGRGQWKDFRDYFNARTTLYDFYPEVTVDERYSDDLTAIGVSVQQQELLSNYNFGLDETIDTKLLKTIADYASKEVGKNRDWIGILKEQLVEYRYRMLHAGDAPLNYLVFLTYLYLIIQGFLQGREQTKRPFVKRYAFLWELPLLFCMRTSIWMFIMMRGRAPERITHSLYFVEWLLLLGMAVRIYEQTKTKTKSKVVCVFSVLLLLLLFGNLPGSVRSMKENQVFRADTNKDCIAIDKYCREHNENFYYEDVYSTVAFSQKVFKEYNTQFANYDIMGGWMCKSPLFYEKMKPYGFATVEEALLEKDNVFMIVSNVEVQDRGFAWITDYYSMKGTGTSVNKVDEIGENYGVYQIIKKDDK